MTEADISKTFLDRFTIDRRMNILNRVGSYLQVAVTIRPVGKTAISWTRRNRGSP